MSTTYVGKQYNSYCDTFVTIISVRKPYGRAVRLIGGHQAALLFANIEVPFKYLGLTITVDFNLLPGNVPSLVSPRDLHDNSLDISPQRKLVTFGSCRTARSFVKNSSVNGALLLLEDKSARRRRSL